MRLIAVLLLTLLIAGCGKRARYLDPPDADAPHYPAHYPPPDEPGHHL
jgi:hypothetical protein